MSTVPARETNRLLIGVAILSGAAVLVLFSLVYFRHQTPPSSVDIAPLKKELSDIRAVNAELTATLEKMARADADKDKANRKQADAQVIKTMTAELAKITEAFEKRVEDLKKKQEEAAAKQDATLMEQANKLLQTQRDEIAAIKKPLEDYKNALAEAAKNGTPPPPPPAAIMPAPTEDKSQEGQEIVKGILRFGLLALCLSNPELAPVLTAIANEMGLFGSGETEVRQVYMQAVQDVAEGRPISEETRKALGQAGREGKIPVKMVENLDSLLRLLPAGPQLRGMFDEGTWTGLKSSSPDGLVADLTRRLREKPSKNDLEDLRKMFPAAGGEPYYSSKADKDKVQKLFDTDFFERKADLWDGPKGLGAIPARE